MRLVFCLMPVFALMPGVALAAEPTEPVPKRPMPSLIRPGDYPSEALKLHQEGDAVVDLTISPRGNVLECSILESSGSRSLDAKSCGIAKDRARFKPATDSSGKPVTGLYRQRLAWRIYEDQPKDTPLNKAFVQWSTCLRVQSSRLARTDLPNSDIEIQTFAACLANESVLGPELVRAAGREADFPATIDELKDEYRPWIASWVHEVRGGK